MESELTFGRRVGRHPTRCWRDCASTVASRSALGRSRKKRDVQTLLALLAALPTARKAWAPCGSPQSPPISSLDTLTGVLVRQVLGAAQFEKATMIPKLRAAHD